MIGRAFASRAISRLDFTPRGADEVLEQDGVGDGTHATGHGRDRCRDLDCGLEVDVAHDAAVDDVDADIDHQRSGVEGVAADQAGRTGC